MLHVERGGGSGSNNGGILLHIPSGSLGVLTWRRKSNLGTRNYINYINGIWDLVY
jgi:hypothetical protein